jgi:hypothetical protein
MRWPHFSRTDIDNIILDLFTAQQMEFSDEHLRFYVYVESRRGVAPKEVLEHLCTSLGDAAPSKTFVYK